MLVCTFCRSKRAENRGTGERTVLLLHNRSAGAYAKVTLHSCSRFAGLGCISLQAALSERSEAGGAHTRSAPRTRTTRAAAGICRSRTSDGDGQPASESSIHQVSGARTASAPRATFASRTFLASATSVLMAAGGCRRARTATRERRRGSRCAAALTGRYGSRVVCVCPWNGDVVLCAR